MQKIVVYQEIHSINQKFSPLFYLNTGYQTLQTLNDINNVIEIKSCNKQAK